MSDKSRRGGGSQAPNKTMLRRTLFLMAACGIVAFLVLAGKLFSLQILEHDKYESLAVEQQVRETSVSAARGTIYDSNMKILAMSASVDTIYISPVEIIKYEEDPVLIAKGLSEILGVDYAGILEKTRDTKSWYKTIATKVEQEIADQVREFKNEYKLKGVKIEADTKRYYPYSSLAAHIIGFVGTDNNGLGGIEAKYENTLKGENGRIVRAKTSAGTDMLFTKFEDYYDAVDGNSVVLTIDSTIQYYVEKHLEAAVQDYDIQNGAAAIAMNVKTGEILALASLGNFDLNNYQDVSDEVKSVLDETEDETVRATLLRQAQDLQWRNKAISDAYEPGSVFKIITLAMALEEGLTGTGDSFYCGGSREVRGRTDPVKCWKTIGHGSQSLTQAVQHSCNVAFVDLGLRVGAEKFYDYADAFGFFNITGIDLGGESGSIWWDDTIFKDPDNLSQLAAASFGQTFNITPLQLITAVSACANGGYLMEPYLVKEVIDSEGNTVQEHEPKVVRQVISEETSATICGILESVVGDMNEGTGRNAYVAGYRIAGKTGTSTKTTKEVLSGEKEYIVSFLGFAPADDPQIAILVMLDNPSGASGIYPSGGQMAAPTVGKMMADILPYMGVEPQYSEGEKENMDRSVPKITGMTVDEAISLLESEGYTYRMIGTGAVVNAQLPQANTVVAAGSTILIYADAEPSGGTETMPDLTGMSYSVARQHLGYYGLYVKTVGGAVANSDSFVVSMQSIPAGTEVSYGTVIEVTLVDNSNLGQY